MKTFVLIAFVAQAVVLQSTSGQFIKTCGCASNLLPSVITAPSYSPCASAPLVLPNVIQTAPSVIQAAPSVIQAAPSVIQSMQPGLAGSLADTLSLLTVSSLLAEKLPFNVPQVVATVPSVPFYGGCGCNGFNGVYY